MFDKRSSCLEHANLDVYTGSFLHKLTFLIEFGSLGPLFHLFTYSGNLNHEGFVIELISNVETSLDISHLNGRASYSCIALGVMLLYVNLLIVLLIRVKQCFFVQFLGLNSVSLVFNLAGKFPTNVLLFVRGYLFA